jgi:hypothetical protein
MLNVRGVVISALVVMLAGLPVRSAESDLDAKAAKLFKVKWLAVNYNRNVTIINPSAFPRAIQLPSTGPQNGEALTLTCQIEFLDPNRVLGAAIEGIVTRAVDGAGRDVNMAPAPAPSYRYYTAPSRRPTPTRPPVVSRWEAFLRSVLRLPSPHANFRPRLVDEWQPTSMNVRLSPDSVHASAGEIRRVQGYFYAVIPESMESIDVPFEPNDAWIQLTPDVEIQVQEAACSGSTYRFCIATRGQGSVPTVNAQDSLSLLRREMPGRFVSSLRFLGVDGKPVAHVSGGGGGGFGGNAGSVSGSGGVAGPVQAFRFIIAVKPTEHKIPFEFEHVPLPKP